MHKHVRMRVHVPLPMPMHAHELDELRHPRLEVRMHGGDEDRQLLHQVVEDLSGGGTRKLAHQRRAGRRRGGVVRVVWRERLLGSAERSQSVALHSSAGRRPLAASDWPWWGPRPPASKFTGHDDIGVAC